MKSSIVSLLAVAGLATAGSAQAADETDLAKAKGCLSCHKIDTRFIGPAYKDVARKYAGQKDAEAKLVTKVLEGGSGVWGQVPMPPNKSTGVTEADARKLVNWILSLK